MKTIKPIISIIVPVFNAEQYLEKCLNSIIEQTFEAIELIIVNDGSTDGSYKIIKSYSQKYKNVKVINQKNQGVVKARIKGYTASQGEYIGWVDADDFVELDMYKKMYDQAIKKHADLVICDYNFFPKKVWHKQKWYKEYKGSVDFDFVNRNTVQWNKIVHRTLLNKIDLVKLLETFGEGAYIIAIIRAKKIITMSEKLYNYRVGQNSLSSNFTNVSWFEDNVLKSIVRREYIISSDLVNVWLDYFTYLVYYDLLLILLISCFNDNKSVYKKYKELIKSPTYSRRKLFDKELVKDTGKIKSLTLRYVVTNSYSLTKLITKLFFNKISKKEQKNNNATKNSNEKHSSRDIVDVQVLLSTMHQNNHSILERMNIRTDTIVINQCNLAEYETFIYERKRIIFMSLPERGVGLSRNTALNRSNSTISLFADDDVVYDDNYSELIKEEFSKYPKADMIVFNVESDNINRPSFVIKKHKRIHLYNCLRYGTYRFAVRTESVKQKNISFSLLFGGGSRYSHGEDSIFISDCIKSGLKVYASPINIGSVSHKKSTWFTGHTPKHFIDHGILLKHISKYLSPIMSLRFVIKTNKYHKESISLGKALRYTVIGK
jgi:glycosyltransferase involved in cell wall biosynthesis